jgi:hypothetical protein
LFAELLLSMMNWPAVEVPEPEDVVVVVVGVVVVVDELEEEDDEDPPHAVLTAAR